MRRPRAPALNVGKKFASCVVGIDPGLDGAWVVLTHTGTVALAGL